MCRFRRSSDLPIEGHGNVSLRPYEGRWLTTGGCESECD